MPLSAIRILELRTTYRGGGGPDKTILLSAKAHNRAHYDVLCVYLRGADDRLFDITRRARELQIPFVEVLEHHRIDLKAVRDVIQQIQSFAPHILHTHDYKTDLLGLLLRPLFPKLRLLATAHGWTLDNRRMNLYNRLDRMALRQFDRVIAVSEATQQALLASRIRASRLRVLYNGIDTQAWPAVDEDARKNAGKQLRQELKLEPSSRLVGFIGRLSPEKDVHTAIEVIQQVVTSIPTTHLLVMGDGEEELRMKKLAQLHGLTDHVHFQGFQPVTPAIYHGLDVYLMTSRTEGLPNTLLEAMACGCPCVVTSVGGIPELVGDSGGAFICPPGDSTALATALIRLLDGPALGRFSGAAARLRIQSDFSFAQRLQRIELIYSELATIPVQETL